MPKEIRAWVIAGIAALIAGAMLAALGLGVGPTTGSVGAAVFAITFLLVKNGYGLRKVTVGSNEERDSAAQQETTPTSCLLFIIRDQIAPIIGVDISIDDQAVARLKGGRFTRVTLSPGEHVLQTTFRQGALGSVPVVASHIVLVAGKAQYVMITPPVNKTAGKYNRTEVVDDATRNQLRAMSFVFPEKDSLAAQNAPAIKRD